MKSFLKDLASTSPVDKSLICQIKQPEFSPQAQGTISNIMWISFLCYQISTINREASWPNTSSVILPLNISSFLRRVKNGVLSQKKLPCAIIFLIPSLQWCRWSIVKEPKSKSSKSSARAPIPVSYFTVNSFLSRL